MAKLGVGIDCIHFVREVLIAAGMSERFDCPYYLPRWGFGRCTNVLERLLRVVFDAEVVPLGEPLRDLDIFIFSVGRQSNHCGIVLAGELWHAQVHWGVHPIPITTELMARLQSVVRITHPLLRRRPETLDVEDFRQ